MEYEIDIYETDLAESMAMWGLGEHDEEHMSFQYCNMCGPFAR